ncbi:glycosyltransferase [Arenimonas sp.]|uniref:glycosyltransferase n=1 Tax=Arenimonas sp. TaxID=1872635 RepID=UPI002E2FFA61|nr:glycosyltransferase [Arenimonas sp.]HEX4853471.1 glycosyltransferase [Arenimonas sp.]
MPDLDRDPRPVLMVLASTYPRWADDREPGFVHELAKRMVGTFRVIAIVPSAPGAAGREVLDGVEVVRFRYAPRRWETLVNDGGILANLKRSGMKYLLLPGFAISQLVTAGRCLRREQVDIVHAHWLLPAGAVAALLRMSSGARTPYLVTSHGADLFALRSGIFQRLKRWVAKGAAGITVVSTAMRRELAAIGVPPSRVSVQPMGVDLSERFTPIANVPRSPVEILFVGRIVAKKGLIHLIDAMPAILAEHPSAFLTVVGFGPEEAACRGRVRELSIDDHVRFVGGVSQTALPELYRRAAVFVAPFVQASDGDQEGLGLVVVEAVGCGCPVVVSDLPAVRDVFANESPAALVKSGSPLELARAVSAVLSSPPGTESLRKSLLHRFDWSVVANGYVDLLGQLVGARGRSL